VLVCLASAGQVTAGELQIKREMLMSIIVKRTHRELIVEVGRYAIRSLFLLSKKCSVNRTVSMHEMARKLDHWSYAPYHTFWWW
jgi:hypothetical protein